MNGSATHSVRIQLLGGFELSVDDHVVRLPLGAQRLLGGLALAKGGAQRSVVAEQLWPDSPRGRAHSNLRSALWQARHSGGRAIVDSSGPRLRLAPPVVVDHRLALDRARVTEPADRGRDGAAPDWLVRSFSEGLLTDWADEWLVPERERWDQIRLHMLETLAQQLMSGGEYLAALTAALAAVEIEPVRESAHRTVVEIFLAEGNAACALKHYQRYRRYIQNELGVAPSRHMMRLIQPLATG